MLGVGDFLVAFSGKPEVQAVLTYLASTQYQNGRVALGGFLSPNKNADLSKVQDPITVAAGGILQRATAFRFDGSDQMPSVVGQGTFWTGIIDWLMGKSTDEVTKAIDASWP